MALNFPSNPVNGQQYTGDNGIVYTYNDGRWIGAGALGNVVPSKVSNNGNELNINSDGTISFPNYTFPVADGEDGQTLVTDGAGNLSWAAGVAASLGSFAFSSGTMSTQSPYTDMYITPNSDGHVQIFVPTTENSTDVPLELTNLAGNVQITTGTNHWQFQQNGNLVLPEIGRAHV